MTEHQGVPARPPSTPPRWRKGTRTMRLGTARSAGTTPWQPPAPVTDPARIKPQGLPKRHTCAECFGPRSVYRQGLFCARCELALFGDSFGYQRVHPLRARTAARAWQAGRKGDIMTWIDWATGVPTCTVTLAWLACVAAERWTSAWVLLYVARGLAVIAGTLYALAGHPSALIPFGLLYLLLWGAHRLFPPTGPRELRHRSPRPPRKTRPVPDYQAPGSFWRMWTIWAWHQNRVLAVLLWVAWACALGGLGLMLVTVLVTVL